MNGETKRFPPDHPAGIKKLSVGCGPKHLRPDWWNVDLRSFQGIDEILDATKYWRGHGVLDFVYSEHFLEHLDLEGAVKFLRETHKALKKGGRTRISTPGLEWVMKTHFKFAPPDSDSHIAETLTTNKAFHGWGHQFLFSQGMLRFLLEKVGFTDVEFFDYGVSNTDALKNLELHGGYSVAFGYPSVWIVEGVKSLDSPPSPKELDAFLDDKYVRFVRSGH